MTAYDFWTTVPITALCIFAYFTICTPPLVRIVEEMGEIFKEWINGK